ncbi:Fe-S protein assembly co-chaperone HscB [Thiomonas sp. FB-6]|uniref:Fe-S protein assembly co-chaperone HscB n=1 Tax=Thiomonas sp. FB-6 TaxID=1158291 RepID=UPI0003A3DD84
MDTAVHGRVHGSPQQGAKAGADFRGDHFALFGLEPRFALDTEALSAEWRRLQALVHPDRFAGGGDAQARVAMQWSTLVNTAYRTLLDPLARAAYLCELRGVAIDAERNTAMPVDFLDEQMQWREDLDQARADGDAQALQALSARVEQRRREVLRAIERHLDQAPPEAEEGAAREAAAEVRVLMFIERFRRDLAPRARRPEAS